MRTAWRNAIASVALIIMGACEADDQRLDETVVIYYKPFNIGTYLPVTPDNIEQQANCVFRVPRSAIVVREIFSVLSEAPPGKFDYLVVRVKIVVDEHDVTFVDIDGGVLLPVADGERRLDAEGLAHLRSVLEDLARERDCMLE